MKLEHLFVAVPAALLILGGGSANAGQTINEAGTVACATDKWDESEPEKGHKLVEYAGRCICIDNDPTAPSRPHDCVGKYEYMPDGSWKGSGTCVSNYKDGDKLYQSLEEGSYLREYIYKWTGGTGKYEGVSGGGTYMYESLTNTLSGGRFKGTIEVP
ncbi:MAG TPA: hypothetical protein VHK26_04775 [Methyloceanibacter sp.]|nr:hypothetical protein [Methyloceanibacter sp.]